MKDIQLVYKADTEEQAQRHLDQLDKNCGVRYPKVIEFWKRNWTRLSRYFQYTKDIRRIMYTTNIIDGSTGNYAQLPSLKELSIVKTRL
jgi:transposase-like protein